MKKLLLLLLCLLLAVPAFAEDVPTLPGLFAIENMLPDDTTFPVFTGPGEEYHVAAKGKAKVSTGGLILCYGRIAGTNWLLVRYSISSDQARIGCIYAYDQLDFHSSLRELNFAAIPYVLPEPVTITDDPGSQKSLGTVSGRITLLAREYYAGELKWAYIEGTLDKTGEPVRGFIPLTRLNGAAPLPDMSVSPYAGDRFSVKAEYELNLPDDALTEGMEVYPLADGTYLIAYRCQSSDRLWMRVISEKGKKLWAKSVPRLYISQITLTDSGFICETFDNPEIDSGMCYTYTCKGKKWTSKKVSWISEPDRAYADNTEHFTLLRHTFGEGGSPIGIELTNRATGASAESTMYSFKPFLYEMDGSLLLLAEDEAHALNLRIFNSNLSSTACIPAPEAIGEPYEVDTADHGRNAVYFFTGYGTDWRVWRLDRETLTFAEEPVTIPVPQACTLTALSVNAAGTHDILMKTDYGSYLCQLEPDGTLLLHLSLPGDVAWITNPQCGGLLLILQNSEGEFVLQYYDLAEG